MKRIAGLMIVVLLLSMLAGCKAKQEEESAAADSYVEGESAGGGIIGGGSGEGSASQAGNQSGGNTAGAANESKDEEKQEQQSEKEKENNSSVSSSPSSSSSTEKEEKPSSSSTEKEEKPSSSAPSSPEEALADLFAVKSNNMGLNYKGQKTMMKGYALSESVEVQYGDRITFGPVSSAQVVVGYSYDKNRKALELINATVLKEEATFEQGMKLYTYTVPQKAASVQLSVPSSLKEDFVLARNNTFSLKEYEKLAGVPDSYISDCLYGKRGLFVGDSICYGTQDSAGGAWASRIAVSTGLKAVNNGVSGSSLSVCRSNQIVDQVIKSKDEDFDYVLLHGGVNDAWESVPVGVVTEGFDADDFDVTTYAGGLEWVLYNAVLCYGDTAAIGYLINFKMPKATPGRCADMSEYVEMGKKICEKWGVTYFDMYNHEQITKSLAFTTNKHTKDYVHPLASGYDVLAPYIEDYMRTMIPCSKQLLSEILG